MSENNLIKTGDLGTPISVEYVARFTQNFSKWLETLGVTKKMPMAKGNSIHRYRMNVNGDGNKDGIVGEGELIPLTHVSKEKIEDVILDYRKYRKSTSAEAIQEHGFVEAVTDTNKAFINYVQKTIRSDFYTEMFALAESPKRTNNAPVASSTLQGVLAHLRANLETVADSDVQMLAIVNPYDVADHVAEGKLNSLGAVFGVNILQDFTGTIILTNQEVERGKVYATISENIVVPYVDVSGELSKAFGLTKDETGFIGLLNDVDARTLTTDTVTIHGVRMFADNIDLVKVGSISAPAEVPEGA